ncbi:transposable element Tcb1 transposase [Trichonephila clavipes]|nr:transposable element Tcb1 transposase [Trichonephila clavipes]
MPSIGGYHPYVDWPAYSPDLNPIDHVWDMLGRRIAALQPSPTCLPKLRRALLDEWYNIPQDRIDNLILSMPRRCKRLEIWTIAQKWMTIHENVKKEVTRAPNSTEAP